jgi:hypothetical protein
METWSKDHFHCIRWRKIKTRPDSTEKRLAFALHVILHTHAQYQERFELRYRNKENAAYHVSIWRHIGDGPWNTRVKHSHFGKGSCLRGHSQTDRRDVYIDFRMRPMFRDGEPFHKHLITSLRLLSAFPMAATWRRVIPFQQHRRPSDLISYICNQHRGKIQSCGTAWRTRAVYVTAQLTSTFSTVYGISTESNIESCGTQLGVLEKHIVQYTKLRHSVCYKSIQSSAQSCGTRCATKAYSTVQKAAKLGLVHYSSIVLFFYERLHTRKHVYNSTAQICTFWFCE